MSEATRIVGIGEVLMDVFEDGSATAGGAPFNVAFHAHQILRANGRGHADIVSAVGRDPWGEHILATVQAAGMSREFVAVNEHPTGVASVVVSGGDAGFEIAADAAWDSLSASAALDELARRCDAVAFGSLAQRSGQSGRTIRGFVSQVKGARLYDVNLRQNTTDGARGYSAAILEESCAVATIVKANAGELGTIGEMLGMASDGTQGSTEDAIWAQMSRLRARFGLFAVVITRGALGAMLLTEETQVKLADSTLRLADIHPVGAGDAFSAGLLYGLSQGCSLPVSAAVADRLASWVTKHVSATPKLDDEILEQLRRAVSEGCGG